MKKRYALVYILTPIIFLLFLTPVVSAADDLSINIVKPEQNGLVGSELKITVTVASTYEVKEVLARVGDREVPLSFAGDYDNLPSWSGTISLNGLKRGEQKLIITAKDYLNHTAQLESPFLYDEKPELTLKSPVNGAVTRGLIPISVSASDDDATNKPTIEIRINNSLIATDKGMIDKTIDLSSYDGEKVKIIFSAKDSANQEVTQSRYIFVDSNPLLHEVDTVNGDIVSYGYGKIFYFEDNDKGSKILKAKDSITNREDFITDDLKGSIADMGKYDRGKYLEDIFPTKNGAIFSVTNSSYLYLWHNGNLTQLGEGENLKVKGDYAIWGFNGDCWWLDLKTGEKKKIIDFVSDGHNSNFSEYFENGDVGTDGSVIYVNTVGMFVYRDGVKSKLNLNEYYYTSEPLTDGTNILFKDGNSLKVYSNEKLTSLVDSDSPIGDNYSGKQYQMNKGWIAYIKKGGSGQGQVWLRTPDGDEKQLTHFGSTSYIYSLSDNGEVILVNNDNMYFSKFDTENPIKVSSSLKKMYITNHILYTSMGRYLFQVKVQNEALPGAPNVNAVGDNDNNITGTAGAGNTVKAMVGEKELGTVIADKEGKFSIGIEPQKAGTVLTVTATDKMGNISEATSIRVQDKTAPGLPEVNAVGDSDTAVTGTTEANSKVTVRVRKRNQLLGEASAKENGAFSIDINVQKAGTKLSITSTDDNGNTSEVKEVVVKDVTAPDAPTVNEVTEKSISVTGTAEGGSTVTVKSGTSSIGEAKAGSDGNFAIPIPVQKASTILMITAVDESENVSPITKVTVKSIDSIPVPTVNPVTDKTKKVTGTTEGKATINVRVAGKLIGTSKANAKGAFNVPIPVQKAGNVVEVTATDRNKNASPISRVTVKSDNSISAPTVDPITDKTKKVTGITEEKAIINVKVTGKLIGTGRANAKGAFNIPIPVQKAGTVVEVIAINSSKDSSSSKNVIVKGT